MPISFEAWPVRLIPPQGEARWTVLIHRGGAFPGWRWLDAFEDHGFHYGIVVIFEVMFGAMTLPSVVLRWLAYRLQRRTDWDVLVLRGDFQLYRPREAALAENRATKADAVARAEQLSSFLSTHDRLPTPSDAC